MEGEGEYRILTAVAHFLITSHIMHTLEFKNVRTWPFIDSSAEPSRYAVENSNIGTIFNFIENKRK